MSNYNAPPHLGFSFNLPKSFTPQQQGNIAMAADNIIMHSLDIAIDADAELQGAGDQSALEPQDIEDIEQRVRRVTTKELTALIDYVTTFIPDIPSEALVATLYKEQNYIPANIDDIADDENAESDDFGFLLEFTEAEHNKLTADYLGELLDIEYNNPLNPDIDDEVHNMAARAATALFIRGTMDVGPDMEFREFLDSINLNILNKTYERGMYVAGLAGGVEALGEPLDTNFMDLMEELEETIDAKTNASLKADVRLPAVKNPFPNYK